MSRHWTNKRSRKIPSMGEEKASRLSRGDILLIVVSVIFLIMLNVGVFSGVASNAPGVNWYFQTTPPYSWWFVTILIDASLILVAVVRLRGRRKKT